MDIEHVSSTLPILNEGLVKPTTPEETEQYAFTVIQNYVNRASETGIVREFLMGTNEETARGYIWNVFNEDRQIERPSNDIFDKLSELASALEITLRDVLPIRVFNVNPSRMSRFLEKCEEDGISLDSLPIVATQNPQDSS